jgi:hypothetical protein
VAEALIGLHLIYFCDQLITQAILLSGVRIINALRMTCITGRANSMFNKVCILFSERRSVLKSSFGICARDSVQSS